MWCVQSYFKGQFQNWPPYVMIVTLVQQVNLPLPRHVLCYTYSARPFLICHSLNKGTNSRTTLYNTVTVKNLTVKTLFRAYLLIILKPLHQTFTLRLLKLRLNEQKMHITTMLPIFRFNCHSTPLQNDWQPKTFLDYQIH